uniref:Uncharacterized protein n=1 Tax=Plectus sambesii TaxID=2011161 RepID=A0A914X9Q3_9BILA
MQSITRRGPLPTTPDPNDPETRNPEITLYTDIEDDETYITHPRLLENYFLNQVYKSVSDLDLRGEFTNATVSIFRYEKETESRKKRRRKRSIKSLFIGAIIHIIGLAKHSVWDEVAKEVKKNNGHVVEGCVDAECATANYTTYIVPPTTVPT